MSNNTMARALIFSSLAATITLKLREVWHERASSRPLTESEQRYQLINEVVMARSGNDIAITTFMPTSSSGVVVLCHGLGTSSNSMLLLAELVHERFGLRTVVYDRAGYRASRVGSAYPFTVQEAADDLADVINVVGQKEKITLIGHSLGGMVAHRFASQNQDHVKNLILIEPTHPQEAKIIKQKKIGILGISETIRLNADLAILGGSAFCDSSEMSFGSIQNPYKSRIEHELKTGRLWCSMRREWQALAPILLDGATQIDRIETPTQVFCSDAVLKSVKHQGEVFSDYLSAGELEVISNSDHHKIILDKPKAIQIVDRMRY